LGNSGLAERKAVKSRIMKKNELMRLDGPSSGSLFSLQESGPMFSDLSINKPLKNQ